MITSFIHKKKKEGEEKKNGKTVLHRKISCKNCKIKVLVRKEKENIDKRLFLFLFGNATSHKSTVLTTRNPESSPGVFQGSWNPANPT